MGRESDNDERNVPVREYWDDQMKVCGFDATFQSI